MAKVVGFTALHYGTDYLAWSIRSIIDHIDELHIAYTAIGSHGHRTDTPCPETRDELYAIASAAAGSKLRWHDGEWPYEGAQRDSIHEYAPDADCIVVLDADEIWPENLLVKYLFHYHILPKEYPPFKRIRVPIIHYWRSFYRCVLHDPAYPIRIIHPKSEDSEGTLADVSSINHMGYAQRPDIVRYKQLTHGHRNEWRKDVDWFADKYMANAQTDCHPVGSDWWQPERVDPLDYMPKFMMDHPYYHLSIIE